jgi:hypothetical protein
MQTVTTRITTALARVRATQRRRGAAPEAAAAQG